MYHKDNIFPKIPELTDKVSVDHIDYAPLSATVAEQYGRIGCYLITITARCPSNPAALLSRRYSLSTSALLLLLIADRTLFTFTNTNLSLYINASVNLGKNKVEI